MGFTICAIIHFTQHALLASIPISAITETHSWLVAICIASQVTYAAINGIHLRFRKLSYRLRKLKLATFRILGSHFSRTYAVPKKDTRISHGIGTYADEG